MLGPRRIAACVALALALLACGSKAPPGGTHGSCAGLLCADVCIDPSTDENNCGTCGNACLQEESCKSGTCQPTCGSGRTECGDVCVDTDSDPDNCSKCGTACASGMSACVGGMCRVVCPVSTTNCSESCVQLQSDPVNCGACGRVCEDGSSCKSGRCVPGCAPGSELCDGSCTDLASDWRHCGSCEVSCGAHEECSGRACVPDGPTSLEITPNTLLVLAGTTFTPTVIARFDDGSERDVSAEVRWSIDIGTAVEIDGSQLRAVEKGVAFLRADLGDRNASLQVTVESWSTRILDLDTRSFALAASGGRAFLALGTARDVREVTLRDGVGWLDSGVLFARSASIPAIHAAISSEGDRLVAWTEERDEGPPGKEAALALDGAALANARVQDVAAGRFPLDVAVSSKQEGVVLAAGLDDAVVETFDGNGGIRGSPRATFPALPATASLGAGGSGILAAPSSDNRQLLVQRYDAEAGWSEPLHLSGAENVTSLLSACNATGACVIGMTIARGDVVGIGTAPARSDWVTLGSAGEGVRFELADVVVSEDGIGTVVWRKLEGDSETCWASAYAPDASWGDRRLLARARTFERVAAAVSRTGEVTLLWFGQDLDGRRALHVTRPEVGTFVLREFPGSVGLLQLEVALVKTTAVAAWSYEQAGGVVLEGAVQR